MSYPKLICKWCGKRFPAERLDTKYCSPHCRDIAMKIRKQQIEHDVDVNPDAFLASAEPVKPKKSYEQYLAEARMRPPSPHLAPPGAKPPIRIPGNRNNY